MIREAYLFFFNNYVGLVLGGWFYKYKLACIVGFLVYFAIMCISIVLLQLQLYYVLYAIVLLQLQLYYVLYAILIAIEVYFIFLSISMIIWRYRSKKIGLKSLVLYPSSTFWLKRMLAKRKINIPVLEKVMEIHINTKQKYKDWDRYNSALDYDISKIINYLESGQSGANVTLTFNTFNHRVVDKLETAFNGQATRLKQVTLPNLIIYSYLPKQFKKVQMHMFGEVKSNRTIHVPEAWELIICNLERRQGG